MKSAFYQGTIVSTTDAAEGTAPESVALRHRRSTRRASKRTSPRRKYQRQSQQISNNMGDVANMALDSSGDPQDDYEMMGRNSVSGWQQQSARTSGFSPGTPGFTSLGTQFGKLPETLPASQFPKIVDDVEHSGEMLGDENLISASEFLRQRDSDASFRPSNPFGSNVLGSAQFGSDIVDGSRMSVQSEISSGSIYLQHQSPFPPLIAQVAAVPQRIYPIQATQTQATGHFFSTSHSNYGTNDTHAASHHITIGRKSSQYAHIPEGEDEGSEDPKAGLTFSDRLMDMLDPSEWLSSGVKLDDDGVPFFDDGASWTLAGVLRMLIYNPIYPEFTSLQQFSWAVLIGIAMGVYTAGWKMLIEACVDFMWKRLPETLLEWGVFTDLDGGFPIYHYMWIVPAVFGGGLSYIFAALPTPIPGQNEFIHNLHSRGVQESETFGVLFILATAGMASGLSLGPELPLILTSGMIGSKLGVLCKQSMLQARVMNLTAASAAIGGFFGFPMAGALFVLEVPHRMGLQYFEALSPAVIASIVAVLTNRLVTGNDVDGYYEYPFLNSSLPSEIFTHAIAYGFFGAAIGVFYTKVRELQKS
jgi:hypothetical protein